jgi:L-aminopeptidase/D-esterase-like protein
LRPGNLVGHVNAILLTGGSAFGLDAASGVMRFLEERGIGFATAVGPVPIVPAAALFDLDVGRSDVRPDAAAGYAACEAATTSVAEGSVGAGAGATVGKMFVGRGMSGMKGGVGTTSMRIGDIVVAALTVVNSAGDIVDWRQGTIVAGARTGDGRAFARSVDVLRRDLETRAARRAPLADDPLRATMLAVVGTNVALTKTQLTKLAMMANTGAGRAINPYHTQGDGDQLFAVSTGGSNAEVSVTALGAIAAELLADAIVRAVKTATGVPGWPAIKDL